MYVLVAKISLVHDIREVLSKLFSFFSPFILLFFLSLVPRDREFSAGRKTFGNLATWVYVYKKEPSKMKPYLVYAEPENMM